VGFETASNTRVDLSWQDDSNAESSFRLEKSTDGGITWQEFASTSSRSYFKTV
jgi:hypothetical protein